MLPGERSLGARTYKVFVSSQLYFILPFGPPRDPALVTFSPFAECTTLLTAARSWECPFQSHPFAELLFIIQETIHMFSHLRNHFDFPKQHCPSFSHK